MGVLTELKPEGVWRFFEDLCGIPHGSYNEKKISDYCVAFARERGLEVYQDQAWNVVIIKEASAGYENVEPLIIQGHLDMVCEKKPDCSIDFEKDGLSLAVDGDYVYAEGTTLGGDDGIAIAYALALLDDDSIPHPRLEAIFTTSEEVGMEGASALDVSMLKSHTVLNLDSEEESTLLVGCAGGCGARLTFPVQREKKKGTLVNVTVGGLQGGHSGVEIDKGRGNANALLSAVLSRMAEELPSYGIISMAGGLKDNAIPREARAELLFPADAPAGSMDEAEKICEACDKELKEKYASADAKVFVRFECAGEGEAEVFGSAPVTIPGELPCGVIQMSEDIPGLVQTSINLGVMRSEKDHMEFRYSLRSSVSADKEREVKNLQRVAEQRGGNCEISGDYPAWEYRKDSPLREDCIRLYETIFGRMPRVEAIHAGLECGLLASKIPDLDAVSMGPDILNVHTTEERMSISSVERMWKLILEIVKRK